MSTLFIIVSHLVEIVLVELAHEAGEIAVFEMFGQDGLGESFILRGGSARVVDGGLSVFSHFEYYKASAIVAPPYDLRVGWILQHSSRVISMMLMEEGTGS